MRRSNEETTLTRILEIVNRVQGTHMLTKSSASYSSQFRASKVYRVSRCELPHG